MVNPKPGRRVWGLWLRVGVECCPSTGPSTVGGHCASLSDPKPNSLTHMSYSLNSFKGEIDTGLCRGRLYTGVVNEDLRLWLAQATIPCMSSRIYVRMAVGDLPHQHFFSRASAHLESRYPGSPIRNRGLRVWDKP